MSLMDSFLVFDRLFLVFDRLSQITLLAEILKEGGPTLAAVARVDGDVGSRTRNNASAMLVDDAMVVDDKAAIKSTATANPTMGTRS